MTMRGLILSGADLTKLNEGLTLVAKPDAKGKWEIGYGHDIPPSPGLTWSKQQAEDQFGIDYPLARSRAASDLGLEWAGLDEPRQAVLADIAYEIGGAGLAQFKTMLAHIRAAEWDQAGQALRASLLFQQVQRREERNIGILTTGAWPT